MIEMKINKGRVDMSVGGDVDTLAPEAAVAFNALLDMVKTLGEEMETKFEYLVCQIMTGELSGELRFDPEVEDE